MSVTYLGPKLLVALSSQGLGGVSTAGTPVTTINSSVMDTARRIAIFSTAGSTSMAVTITGIIEGGGTRTEVIIGSSTPNFQSNSVWDYTNLTAATVSSAPNIPVWFGTSSQGGFPWKLTDWTKGPQDLSGYITLTTSANTMSGRFDITLDDPTSIIGRGSTTTLAVFNSTGVTGIATGVLVNTIGQFSVNAVGVPFPITAWRLTITSSSTSAGSVSGAVMQSGV